MIAHVHYVVKNYDLLSTQISIPWSTQLLVASMLLAASRYSDRDWKKKTMDRTRAILEGSSDRYLLSIEAHRQSVLLRNASKLEESSRVLRAFIDSTALPEHDTVPTLDARLNAQCGSLRNSLAENLIQANDLAHAEEEMYKWEPLSPSSPTHMERIVLSSRSVVLGRILRFRGRFDEALPYFESLLEEINTAEYFESSGGHNMILSNIADLHCEMNNGFKAEEVLAPLLKKMTDWGCENNNTGQRIQLSLAESFLRRGMYAKAGEIFERLRLVCEPQGKPDVATSISIFRIWAGLARISHLESDWNEASHRWREALNVIEDCGWHDGFIASISRLSLAHTYKELGDVEQSTLMLQLARSFLDQNGPEFFWTGLGSYWYDCVGNMLDIGGVPPSRMVGAEKSREEQLFTCKTHDSS